MLRSRILAAFMKMRRFSIKAGCPLNSSISVGRIVFSNSFSAGVNTLLSVFKLGFAINCSMRKDTKGISKSGV